jgi:hypothetical protein
MAVPSVSLSGTGNGPLPPADPRIQAGGKKNSKRFHAPLAFIDPLQSIRPPEARKAFIPSRNVDYEAPAIVGAGLLPYSRSR